MSGPTALPRRDGTLILDPLRDAPRTGLASPAPPAPDEEDERAARPPPRMFERRARSKVASERRKYSVAIERRMTVCERRGRGASQREGVQGRERQVEVGGGGEREGARRAR